MGRVRIRLKINVMRRSFVLILILFIVLVSTSFGNGQEGTTTYRDYIFVMVHGMNDDATVFTGGKSFGNLKAYLENNLGLTGRVFC